MLLAGFVLLLPGSTPEGTITEFVDHVNAGEYAKAARLVQGGKPDANYEVIVGMTKSFRFSIDSMKSAINGNRATVTVTTTLTGASRGSQTDTETVTLAKVNNEWLIVPPKKMGPGSISSIASVTTDPSLVFANAKVAAKKTACLSNLKQLATAMMIFLADHDDVFKLNASRVKAALQPYTKNDKLWYCPTGSSTVPAYSFNAKLAGKNSSNIKDPAKTVMMYEGAKGKVTDRHDGHGMVAFADGHVKIYTPAAAAKLKWNH